MSQRATVDPRTKMSGFRTERRLQATSNWQLMVRFRTSSRFNDDKSMAKDQYKLKMIVIISSPPTTKNHCPLIARQKLESTLYDHQGATVWTGSPSPQTRRRQSTHTDTVGLRLPVCLANEHKRTHTVSGQGLFAEHTLMLNTSTHTCTRSFTGAGRSPMHKSTKITLLFTLYGE